MVADETALLTQHADVLFDMDERGRLVGLNEPDPEPAPRLFLARGHETAIVLFRADVPARTIERCGQIVSGLPPWDGRRPAASAYDELRAALAGEAGITDESNGPACRFGDRSAARQGAGTVTIAEASADLLDRYSLYTRSVLAWRSPVVVVLSEGAAVSACYCARRRATACEAGVATAEPFRGRGLATAVVGAWRDAVEARGMTALYSTSWDNVASRRVAERLGLVAYAETLSLR